MFVSSTPRVARGKVVVGAGLGRRKSARPNALLPRSSRRLQGTRRPRSRPPRTLSAHGPPLRPRAPYPRCPCRLSGVATPARALCATPPRAHLASLECSRERTRPPRPWFPPRCRGRQARPLCLPGSLCVIGARARAGGAGVGAAQTLSTQLTPLVLPPRPLPPSHRALPPAPPRCLCRTTWTPRICIRVRGQPMQRTAQVRTARRAGCLHEWPAAARPAPTPPARAPARHPPDEEAGSLRACRRCRGGAHWPRARRGEGAWQGRRHGDKVRVATSDKPPTLHLPSPSLSPHQAPPNLISMTTSSACCVATPPTSLRVAPSLVTRPPRQPRPARPSRSSCHKPLPPPPSSPTAPPPPPPSRAARRRPICWGRPRAHVPPPSSAQTCTTGCAASCWPTRTRG